MRDRVGERPVRVDSPRRSVVCMESKVPAAALAVGEPVAAILQSLVSVFATGCPNDRHHRSRRRGHSSLHRAHESAFEFAGIAFIAPHERPSTASSGHHAKNDLAAQEGAAESAGMDKRKVAKKSRPRRRARRNFRAEIRALTPPLPSPDARSGRRSSWSWNWESAIARGTQWRRLDSEPSHYLRPISRKVTLAPSVRPGK